MDAEPSPLDAALCNYPIVQTVHIFIIFIALPPVILLLTQLSKIALHHNCKFLLHAWVTAFLLTISSHIAFVVCDFFNGKYITERNDDPPIRLLIFAVHGFAHALSSAQELMLSMERAVSCAFPVQYHQRNLAKVPAFAAECFSVTISLTFLWQISHANILFGCYIINAIDLASFICLSITTFYVVERKKYILQSSLNEKYQIREAFAIIKVMLPCNAISLVLKVISTFGPWAYALGLIESKYMFTITSGMYLIVESLNCMICPTIVLMGHTGLRRNTKLLISRKKTPTSNVLISSDLARSMYFAALQTEWN